MGKTKFSSNLRLCTASQLRWQLFFECNDLSLLLDQWKLSHSVLRNRPSLRDFLFFFFYFHLKFTQNRYINNGKLLLLSNLKSYWNIDQKRKKRNLMYVLHRNVHKSEAAIIFIPNVPQRSYRNLYDFIPGH